MVANGVAAAYSLVQGVRCVVSMVRGSVLFSKPLAWAIFSGDQVLSSCLVFSLHASPPYIAYMEEPKSYCLRLVRLVVVIGT